MYSSLGPLPDNANPLRQDFATLYLRFIRDAVVFSRSPPRGLASTASTAMADEDGPSSGSVFNRPTGRVEQLERGRRRNAGEIICFSVS